MPKMCELKRLYQDKAVASSYDNERFSSIPGRTFNALEKRAIRRAVRRVCVEITHPVVLDVACGTGRITETLLNEGLHVTGADISQEMMEVAQERCARFGDRVTFQELDLNHLDLPDESFDLVSCIKVLHHFDTDERAAVLRELARVSRRYVLVSMSFSNAFYRWRRRVKRRLGFGTSTNCTTRNQLHQETDAAGLEICKKYWVAPLIGEDLLTLLRKR